MAGKVDAPLPAARAKEAGERTKTTLFIRNLPFDATQKELEETFSHFGPIRAAFIIDRSNDAGEAGAAAKSSKAPKKGIGFVHFALAEDAANALALIEQNGISIRDRKLLVEFAMRKNAAAAAAPPSKKEETAKPRVGTKRPRAEGGSDEGNGAAAKLKRVTPNKAAASPILLIEFDKMETPFDRKQLYKRLRKSGQVKDIEFPHAGRPNVARVAYIGAEEAKQAYPKLEGHQFKGCKMRVAFEGRPVATPKQFRLIVRNLPFAARPEDLQAAFAPFGHVAETTIPVKGKDGAKSCGFGFVQMGSREEAQAAMDALNGKEIKGRMVAVDWSLGKNVYLQRIGEGEGEEEKKQEEDAGKSRDRERKGKREAKGKEKGRGEAKDQADEEQGEEVGGPGFDSNCDSGSDPDPRLAGPLGNTVFIRNVSFTTEEQDLLKALTRFGPVEYVKIVRDPQTGLSKGTAFAQFRQSRSVAQACEASAALDQADLEERQEATAKGAPENTIEEALASVEGRLAELSRKRTGKALSATSVQPQTGPSHPNDKGGVVVDGRALLITLAVGRKEASRLKKDSSFLDSGPQDRRNLSLLSESLVKCKTAAARKFWPTVDVGHRERVLQVRRREFKENHNLFVSPTRLSLRYLPTSLNEVDIKNVLRTAVRRALALVEGTEGYPIIDEKQLLHARQTKPYLRQAKVVRATKEAGAKSKGYAFAEWSDPTHALLAVRYLTNYAPGLWRELLADKFTTSARRHTRGKEMGFQAKIPLVEFATEKASVVAKRKERLARQRPT